MKDQFVLSFHLFFKTSSGGITKTVERVIKTKLNKEQGSLSNQPIPKELGSTPDLLVQEEHGL